MATFDKQACDRRNAIAAKRDGVNAVPVTFLRSAPALHADTDTFGSLPADMDAALERINANLPEGAKKLTADDVHIRYMEAANSQFISDRHMFLDDSTLKNIGADAERGFAFMNSHRTGGLSHQSELPFGRAFAGKFSQSRDGDRMKSISDVGVYMLRGVHPNGANGPSTDDLAAGIDAGTIFDVSVGLHGGSYVCDVCGTDLDARNEDGSYLCPHVPGTGRKMTASEMDAQTQRGVPTGFATYSLVGAHCGEVSAVYDGAVPGAGFRKALSLSKLNQLSREDTLQSRTAYANLLSKGDLNMGEDIVTAIKEGFANLKESLGMSSKSEVPATPLQSFALADVQPVVLSVDSEALAAVQAELAELKSNALAAATEKAEALAATEAERVIALANLATVKAEAIEAKLMDFKKSGKFLPAADEAARLLLSSPLAETFEKFLVDNGTVAAFRHDGTTNTNASPTQITGDAALALAGEDLNTDAQIATLAAEYAKTNGCDMTKALREVCKMHPDLAANRNVGIPVLG